MEVMKPERIEPDVENMIPQNEIMDLIERISEYQIAIKDLRDQIKSYRTKQKELIAQLSESIPLVDIPSAELRDYVFDLYWGYDQVVRSSPLRSLVKNRLPLADFADIVVGVVSVTCPKCGETYRHSVKSRTQVASLKKPYNQICEECKAKSRQARYSERQEPNLAYLRSLSYPEYLKTQHWQETRRAALKRAGRKCQVCNSTENLHVHHRTYDNLGQEQPTDLTVLCKACHEKAHNIKATE